MFILVAITLALAKVCSQFTCQLVVCRGRRQKEECRREKDGPGKTLNLELRTLNLERGIP
jgi:hypothetical protein